MPMLNARYALISGLILAALGMIGLTVLTYVREASHEVREVHQSEEGGQGPVTADELQSLFRRERVQGSRYAVIADRNLFAPDRKAWEPPPPAPGPEEKPAEPTKPLPPLNPNDVFLHGTSVTNSTKLAILEFNRFLSPIKRRVVLEGETVRDDGERGKDFFYHVKEIHGTQVVLVDASQRSFEVELFSTKSNVSGNFAISTMTDSEKDRLVQQGALEKISTPFGPNYRQAPSGKPQDDRIEEYRQKFPDKEKLVEQGEMERIITPFGPAYRKKK
ncbi:MAG: hypothetical protein EOM12_11965 [Verrucomicrobiae bacterium]|nr:hypothetical protein [Verrucomicrobiae bacterium]